MGISQPASDRPIDTSDQIPQPPSERAIAPQIEYELRCAEQAVGILGRTDVRSYLETSLGTDAPVIGKMIEGIKSGLTWKKGGDFPPSLHFRHDDRTIEDPYSVMFLVEDGTVTVSSSCTFDDHSVKVELNPYFSYSSEPPSPDDMSSTTDPSGHPIIRTMISSLRIEIVPDTDKSDPKLYEKVHEVKKTPGRTVLDLSDTHTIGVEITRTESSKKKFAADAESPIPPVTQPASQI
jgi:hypothetical protein